MNSDINKPTKAKRRKYRVKNKFRFITFLTVSIIVLAFAVSALSSAGSAAGSELRAYISVRVEEGDTLWNIAQNYGPKNADIRKTIYEIKQINGITASSLQAGQYISVPTEL